MSNADIDLSALSELAKDMREAQETFLARAAERGYQLLREEVPKDTTNLQQGVAPPDVKFPIATLTVSARSARLGGGEGIVHHPSGTQKTVNLKPQQAFNYAEVVAKGRPAISPKKAKVLIIPVASAPSGESYLIANGKVYIFRRSAKAVPANPYDERAAKRLESEADRIGNAVLSEFF